MESKLVLPPSEDAVRPTVNPLLQKERDTATFKALEITNLLDGGAAKTKRRRYLNNLVFSDSAVQKCCREKHSADEPLLYENALRQGLFLADLMVKHKLNQEESDYVLETLLEQDVAYVMHYLMFLPALVGMGTKEQAEKWVGPATRSDIIGTYAQTELGQGSSLRNVETNAVYDPETQEFVLNTPLPTGMKWWPGGLARTSTHAIVMAKLILNGKSHGLQPFIVQIRSLKDHSPMPGCSMGSIGDKISRLVTDNGYLIMKNVRIPRENMLMKNNEVSPDGKFTKKGADKASYGTMVRVRSMLVRWTSMWTAKAAVIATRYAAVRIQGELEPGSPPVQILDYLTQQQKVFPCIAQAYAFKFAEWGIMRSFENVMLQVEKGDFSGLPVLHANSSGLKAYCTENAIVAIEKCRRSLGGHGYSLSSGLVSLYTAGLGAVTYEGEATVMYTQSARYLIKEMERSLKGKEIVGELSYLNDIPQGPTNIDSIKAHNFAPLIKAFNTRSYFLLGSTVKDINRSMKNGVPPYEATNVHSLNMIRATKAHLEGYLVANFIQNVMSFDMSDAGRRVLSDLCILYAITRVLDSSGEFLETKALTADQLQFLKGYEPELLNKLRPEAVSLVDAFDLPDEALYTSVGNYDGWVYDRLTERTKDKNEVDPAIKKYFLTRQKSSKL